MAKNTSSSAFRKIDVDKYNEDYYQDDEEGSQPGSPPSGPDEQEIRNLMSQSRNAEALKNVLHSAPIRRKDMTLRVIDLVLDVLLAIKTTDMEKVVATLEREHVDALMKYIYAGFENPTEGRSAHLLSWHEKVYAKGGMGCIVRVLTDRM